MKRLFCIVLTLISSTAIAAEKNLADLFSELNPSVVELHVKALGTPQPGQVTYKQTSVGSLGSGVLINEQGQILTAAHVVDKALEIEVEFVDGSTTPGYVLWVEKGVDLAMIQVSKIPKGAKIAKVGDSAKTRIGESIFVIGAPYGISHTLTVGHLSGRRTSEPLFDGKIEPVMLQTDASINQGNSGGPMFNMNGEVIGIVSSILSRSGGNEGLGFVVSSETVNDVINAGTATWGGLISFMIPRKIMPAMNMPYDHGVLVQQVIPNSLAAKVGIKGGTVSVTIANNTFLMGGDIILEILGVELKDDKSMFKVREKFAKLNKGDSASIKLWRQGKLKNLSWKKD